MTRAVKPVINVLLFLARQLELARVAALAGGQQQAPGPILALVTLDAETAVLLFPDRFRPFFGTDIQAILAHDLMPALDQVLFPGAIQPQLAFSRLLVRLCVHPLAFR